MHPPSIGRLRCCCGRSRAAVYIGDSKEEEGGKAAAQPHGSTHAAGLVHERGSLLALSAFGKSAGAGRANSNTAASQADDDSPSRQAAGLSSLASGSSGGRAGPRSKLRDASNKLRGVSFKAG